MLFWLPLLALADPVTDAATEALAALGEAAVDNPHLCGPWRVDPTESGFASNVERVRVGHGTYEAAIEVVMHHEGTPWLWFEGHAVEVFGPQHLCVRWRSAEVVRVAEGHAERAEALRPHLMQAALDAQPCQGLTERSETLLRLDNGQPYVERRPELELSMTPAPPWSIRYDGGSHDVTTVEQVAAGSPIRWRYDPVTPTQSSSGTYSGGAPAEGALDPHHAEALWGQLALLKADPTTHTSTRRMGTGEVRWVTPGGEGTLVLTAAAATGWADLLRRWTKGPDAGRPH